MIRSGRSSARPRVQALPFECTLVASGWFLVTGTLDRSSAGHCCDRSCGLGAAAHAIGH